MSIGKETFDLNKTEFNQKISRIIKNFRANSQLIGEPKEFVLRACRLSSKWSKLSCDAEVSVYLRNIEIAGNRKVKMISLERGTTRQPVPKAKLLEELYPAKQISRTPTTAEKHYNAVKAAMRGGIYYQLKAYRDSITLPIVCSLTGRKIRLGMKTDVDHIGLCFSEIADSFIREKGLRYTDVALVGPPTAKRFKDDLLWQEWVAYHMEKARYSLVLASANRSKGSEGYQTPEDLYGTYDKEDPEDLSLDF